MQEESELLITRAEADVAEWCPHLVTHTLTHKHTHNLVVSWQLEVISFRVCVCVCVCIFVRTGASKHIV